MIRTHNLGFPRIGSGRELKFALESYWKGQLDESELEQVGREVRASSWQLQSRLDLLPVGDFSFYDQVLDISALVGNLPERALAEGAGELESYFRAARGRGASCACGVSAAEMTKWFDTNYHYIVPELCGETGFSLHAERLLGQVREAQLVGRQVKPVVLGPVSYLLLGKTTDGSDALKLLPRLLPVYRELLQRLAEQGVEWVQLDEPVLATDLTEEAQGALRTSYRELSCVGVKVMLANYFGALGHNLALTCSLPVHALHVDAVRGRGEVARLVEELPSTVALSLGVIDGRNIWRADLSELLDFLAPLAVQLEGRLWLAPSCSLLHVPVDLKQEHKLSDEVQSWLAFARQKLEELDILARGLNHGREAVARELRENVAALAARARSPLVHRPEVKQALLDVDETWTRRGVPAAERRERQRARLGLPLLPTTTIGSFPQTSEIRRLRRQHRQGELADEAYVTAMREQIASAVREQEAIDLDVLVHGEPERNDMVEYFGEQLDGFVFSEQGWVQSYGSRCVKPPILLGDVKRRAPMTVPWIKYAQALTYKPMKGMLTGPVTILNWSFVRDDQPRETSCEQLAVAIREEVLDLEEAGIRIIQIDEAALREGLPLRRAEWEEYLSWAVRCFRIAAGGVKAETQIHSHMCYSEFNDIIAAIAAMDADVITIENSRSRQELLGVFDTFEYDKEIGPGVYDIHSPNVPSKEQIVLHLREAARKIPLAQLWVNPDCGLKTRSWEEVRPALRNMVAAAQALRAEASSQAAAFDRTVVV